MALTLVSRKNQAVDEQSSQNRSFAQGALRQGIKGIERLAEGAAFPADIAHTAAQAVGAPVQQAFGLNAPIERAQQQFSPEYVQKLHPYVRERIGEFQKATGGKQELPSQTIRRASGSILPKDYLESENPVEKVIDTTISALPFRFALGAPDVIKAIAQEVGGSIGKVGAEEAGFGALGQFVGGVAGSGLSGRLTDMIRKENDPTKLAGLAQSAEKTFYAKERELGPKVYGPASEYKKELSKISNEIENTSALSSSEKKDLLDKIDLYKSDIKPEFVKGKIAKELINGSTLIDRKKEINALWPDVRNKTMRNYLERIQKSMLGEADKLGKDHPEWLKSWKSGDDIHKALNYKFELTKMIDDIPYASKILSNPLAKLAIGSIGGAAFTPKKALILSTVVPAYKSAEQIWGFVGKEETQKLLGEAFKNVINRNTKNFLSTAKKINSAAERYEQKNPITRSSSGLRLVSRANNR